MSDLKVGMHAKIKQGKKGKLHISAKTHSGKKKKKAAPVDSAALEAPVKAEEFDYVDGTDSLSRAQPQKQQVKEKKGLFSFLKKKPKDQKPLEVGAPEEKPTKKKKNKKVKEEPKPEDKKKEDDGF